MKKLLILQAALLSFSVASAQAADTNCISAWEQDHTVNYEKCVSHEKSMQVASKFSSCLDNWERDNSLNLQGCTTGRNIAHSKNKAALALN